MPRTKARASSRNPRPLGSAEQSERNKAKADRLDNLVADAEQRVTEQALRYEMAVFDGQDGKEEKKALRVFEDTLFEMLKARSALSKRYP